MTKLTDFLIPNIGKNNHEMRRQWVIDQLKLISPKTRLLDAGAGTQQFKKYCTHLDYVSQDFAQYLPSEKQAGLQNPEWDYGSLDIISDIVDIPQPDASFGAILCSEVLEHIPYPSRAIEEFSRLLKPNGVLLITAPFCALTHQAPYFHATGFSPYYYKQILSDFGFTNIELVPNGSYFEYFAQEVHRLNGVSKQYTIKKKGLSFYQKIVSLLFLRLLNKQFKKDTKSSDLLCYGYFVRCTKI